MVPALIALIAVAPLAHAAVAVVPTPVDVVEGRGTFTLGTRSVVIADDATAAEAETLAASLRQATGFSLRVVSRRRARRLCPSRSATRGCRTWVRLRLDSRADTGAEGYRLVVRPGGVTIRAATAAGLFYAGQTLRQLLPTAVLSQALVTGVAWEAPAVRIADAPRFRWRGMHLDVARSFMPAAFIVKLIDTLALHKINRLHWHLTDDQGWRIAIDAFPDLTAIGSMRTETSIRPIATAGIINLFLTNFGTGPFDGVPVSGFYTKDDVRMIVAHAAARHITIVPEIDMPGHIQSAIAAYPELGNVGPVPVATTFGIGPHILNAEESTFAFLETVLAEVVELIPGDFVHIGGDEVLIGEWEASPRVQERLVELGLPDEHALVSHIVNRMVGFLASKGRRAMGWNDILRDGLGPDVAIMSWTGVQPGVEAVRQGREVVMCPLTDTYFDHIPGVPLPGNDQALLDAATATSPGLPPAFTTTLDDVYAFDPVPESLTADEATRVLGTQGLVWTEYIRTPEDVEAFAFPRMAALAEVAWTPRDRRDADDFAARLETHLERLDASGVEYRIPGR